MNILHILTVFLSIFFAYGGVYDSTIPLEISKVLRNNTKFVSRLPAESSFRTERRFTDSKLYSSPVCYSYSSLNGDWNNGQYDSVTCNYNSLDKCISVVANMGATKYIFLGCASNVLLSEGYDPWAYYIEDGCKNNFITVNGQGTLATVCGCSYNFCNTERFYQGNGVSSTSQKVSLLFIIVFFILKIIFIDNITDS